METKNVTYSASPNYLKAAMVPIHVINLDRSPDRLAEFQRRNAHLSDVVRFSAIDARTLDREQLVRDGSIAGDCHYKGGFLGSAMSHISLWKKAAKEERTITVVEDDVIFSRYFAERSQAFLAALPTDWDFVQWGWNFDAFLWVDVIPQIIKAKMVFDQDQLRRNIYDFQNAPTVPAPVRLLHSFGILCYSITPKGACALLSHCLPLDAKLIDFPGFGVRIQNNSLDCVMNGAYPSLKAFVCMPPLAVAENKKEESTNRATAA
jgi:glycosyl transferase, family 25